MTRGSLTQARRLATLSLEVLVWWGLTLGVWLITLSAVSAQEAEVAVPVALLCGVVAVAGRRAADNVWGLRPGWLLPLAALPVTVVSDTAQVLASAVTRRAGRFEEVPVHGGKGSGPAAAGRRALATFLVGASPGSYVVDIDPDTGDAKLHVASSRGPKMQRIATR
jgi:hypothetical protein